ncbi:hypothetical protein ABIC22_001221 [Paenibacillus sp. PvP094]
MGFVIVIAILYAPILYRIHRRLDRLEKEIERLKNN